ncbi:uncharacterized protein LOC123323051 [Coccinella septempunctata]|uniref:uncharacterized protein LOC123323051 n=1 Tax=Coccinella septempunctata TaxID=41139 RepID=UPI001D073BAE|nr:uncharacterized protein LOC123323051 [Coccinella septempunctata]
MFRMKGYNTIYNEGIFNRNDGVMIYIEENITYDCRKILIDEMCWLEVTVQEKSGKSLLLTALYRSPKISLKQFNMGDVNIDLLSDENFVEEYKNIMSSCGYVSMINRPTRPESRTCLDHFFVKGFNLQSESADACVLQYLVTDHYPVILTLDFEVTYRNVIPEKYRKYVNYNKLKDRLRNETWMKVYEAVEVNEIAGNFVSILTEHIEQSTNIVKIRKKDRIRKEWISPAICELINKKNELYRRLKLDHNNLDLKNEYTRAKNHIKKKIKET